VSNQVEDRYWNTKQQAGQPDSVDADSIEVAKFKDGHYWVKVLAYDIRNNYDSESVYVQVANFRPKVKETDPEDGETDVPIHKDIYVRFSESMDRGITLWSAISISPGVSGDWEWLSSTEIEFTPDPSFVENTTYTVSLSSQLKDMQGQELIPYSFSFTTDSTNGFEFYPTRFYWEDITGPPDVSVSWFDNYYAFQMFGYFSFPFYGYGYDIIIFNRRGSIWFDTNRDWCHFDLPTAGGSGQPVMAVYNDSLRHLWGHYSRGESWELFNPNRELVRWTYTCIGDTTQFEAVLFGDGTIRFNYIKCDIDTFYNDGGSGISRGDGIHYSSITEDYGPVYELAPGSVTWPSSYIATTNPTPGRPKDLAANWPMRSEFVNLIWRPNPEPDLDGYNVYRRHGDSLEYVNLGFTTAENFTDTLVQLGNTYIYRVTALDTFNLESAYSDSVVVKYGPREVDNPLATAFNNASRIIRNPSTGELLMAYTSYDHIMCITSTDDGSTWSSAEMIAPGQFPTLVLDSGNNPCCLFGRWVGIYGYGEAQLYYTKFINDHWTTPSLLFSVDSVYGDPELAIPTPSACLDSEDTIHIVWNSPMGKDYVHRFAVWYGNLYGLDTIPVFNYVQLDTIWVYEKSRWSYSGSIRPALAVDDQDVIHVVFDTDGGCPWLRYRYRDNGVWSEKPKNDTFALAGSYYPDLEFFGDRLHLVWDYRYPDTTYDHAICYRSKAMNGWDTVMAVYEPLPFNQFGNPVSAGGWYTIWADQDICYSRFNGATWEDPEMVQVTTELSAHPTAIFRQDLNDTCLYIAWTEGDSAPYSIRFKKITVPSVPKYYNNLGQETQSPYCLSRDGYEKFGDEAYKSVDLGKHKLSYRFINLDPEKVYRLDVSYYFEDDDDIGSSKKNNGHRNKSQNSIDLCKIPIPAEHEDCPERGKDSLVQLLEVDLAPIDTSYVYRKRVTRVSKYLPASLYQDEQIDINVMRISGKYVVCGEIGLYEFGEETKGAITKAGGSQSKEESLVQAWFVNEIYPNPTKNILKIRFNSPDERKVTVKLYDVVGKLVKKVFDGKAKVGMNEFLIMAKDLSAGIYFVRVVTVDHKKTRKVIFLR